MQEIGKAFRHDADMERYRNQPEMRRALQNDQDDVLRFEQAERLLRMLLDRLAHDNNTWARFHVAGVLYYLTSWWVESGMWGLEDWSKFSIVREATRALIEALNDENLWVRGAAAESLIEMRCSEAVKPIIDLYKQYREETFSFLYRVPLERLLESHRAYGYGARWTEEDAELVQSCLRDSEGGNQAA